MPKITKDSEFYHNGQILIAKDRRKLFSGEVFYVDQHGYLHPEEECVSIAELINRPVDSDFEPGDLFIHNGHVKIVKYVFSDLENGRGIIVDYEDHRAHPIDECEHYSPDLDEEEINTVLSMAACCTWEDIELFESMPKNQWQQVWDRMPSSSRKRVHEQIQVRNKLKSDKRQTAEAC